MGNDGSNLRPVEGTAELDVDEINNIRSPETNEANIPNREVFDHFFAMEVTWK